MLITSVKSFKLIMEDLITQRLHIFIIVFVTKFYVPIIGTAKFFFKISNNLVFSFKLILIQIFALAGEDNP